MSAARPSFCRLIALLLLAAVIGVYGLYTWYTVQLKAQIADQDERIAASAVQIGERNTRIAELQQEFEQLNAHVQALQGDHSEEKRQLSGQLVTAAQVRSDLEQALEDLRRTDAEVIAGLTAERDQGLTAIEALQARLLETESKASDLQNTLNGLRLAIADSAVEHRQQIEQLERHLNERISLAKATPQDEALLRAAQAAGLLPTVADETDQREEANALLAHTQSELEALRVAFEQAEQDHASQLAEVETALQTARLERDRASAESATALADALARVEELSEALGQTPTDADLSALQAQLDATLAERDAFLAERDAAMAERDASLATAQARIETLSRSLEQAPSDETLEALRTELERVEAARIVSDRRAEDTLAELNEARAAHAQALADLEKRMTGLTASPDSGESPASAATDGGALVTDELKTALAESRQALDETRLALDEERRARTEALEANEARVSELQNALADAQRQAAEAESARARARAQMRALSARLAELDGISTERGTLLKLAESELRFAPGTADLSNNELPSLDAIAALSSEHADLTIEIEGHTDSVGDEESNRRLSQQRAEAVKDALVRRGVTPERLHATGAGPSRPIADNATPQGRAQNRRVEIYVREP